MAPMNAKAQPKRDDCVKSYEWLAACSLENAPTTSAIPAMSRIRLNLRTLSASRRSPYLYIGPRGGEDEAYIETFCALERAVCLGAGRASIGFKNRPVWL